MLDPLLGKSDSEDKMKPQAATRPLRAVYDDDLDTLLDNLKLSRALNEGRLRCRVCGDPVSRDSLLALVPDVDAVTFICTKADCLKQYLKTQEA